jgi:ribosomal protein L32
LSIEKLKKSIKNAKFCKKCGEYMLSKNKCSNPFCPEKIEDTLDEIKTILFNEPLESPL